MKITPLKMWVQNVLPVVYDDSLSYYEMIGKINEKTNEIINQVNENTDGIEALNYVIQQLGDIDELKALLEQVETIVSDLYTTDIPEMDSANGNAGVADHAARSDHSHPSDTSKADVSLGIDGALAGQYVKIKTVEGGVPTEFENGLPHEIPSGGATGQALRKESNGDYAVDWGDVHDLPSGGTTGQVLKKNSNTNYDAGWESINTARIKGKKIAIYGDSWSTNTYGSLGKDYIESITGVSVHVSAHGSYTMAQIYSELWDSYSADIYIIEGGLNDKSTGVGATSFINAVKNLCNAIRQVNSNAEIYFVTPPHIISANQYQALFPLEFYRIILWRLAPISHFNVINALKWTDIKFRSDNIHPTTESESLIGQHICTALNNYGDEETHINEFTNLNQVKQNQIIFVCFDGSMRFQFQNYSATADVANNVNQALGNLDTIFQNTQMPCVNGSSGSSGVIIYEQGSPNNLRIYVFGMAVGDTYQGGFGFIPVTVNGLVYAGG